MTLRPCVQCGEPSPRSRCDQHRPKPALPKASPRLKGYDTSWDRLSRKARKMQPWCSHCGAVDDLTTDHSPEAWAAKAAGKRITLNMLTVLCRPCNSAKGAARGNNAVTRGHGPSATIREPGGKAEFELHTENVPVTVAGKPKKGG